MKYENFEKVKEIVKEISDLESDLNKLKNKNDYIDIYDTNRWNIFSVNIRTTSDDKNAALGKRFIEELITVIKDRIGMLKMILEKLLNQTN